MDFSMIFESPTNHCRLEARRAQVLQDQQEEEMRREQEASNCLGQGMSIAKDI